MVLLIEGCYYNTVCAAAACSSVKTLGTRKEKSFFAGAMLLEPCMKNNSKLAGSYKNTNQTKEKHNKMVFKTRNATYFRKAIQKYHLPYI